MTLEEESQEPMTPSKTAKTEGPKKDARPRPIEGVPLLGVPTLQVDASCVITHKRKLAGAVVVGEIGGAPILELEVQVVPRGRPAVRSAEAEWMALLLALSVARKQRRYHGPLQVLTDAQSNIHAWSNSRGADTGWGTPCPSWCKEVSVLWVPRTRITTADHALRFWMHLVTDAMFTGRLPVVAHAFNLPAISKEQPFCFRLSLRGSEVRVRLEKDSFLDARVPAVPRAASLTPTASAPR